jgi:hypothetical protein
MIKHVIAATAAVLLSAGVVSCERKPAPFSLQISVTQVSVKRGTPSVLRVVLSNTSSRAITLADDLQTICDFSLGIRDVKGRAMPEPPYLGQSCGRSVPPAEGGAPKSSGSQTTVVVRTGSTIIKTIKPDESLEYQLPLDKLLAELQLGTYQLQVSRSVPDLSAHPVKSNPLTIRLAD